jgi:hypothetical protein
LAEVPVNSNQVLFISGDSSANIGPQNDSLWKERRTQDDNRVEEGLRMTDHNGTASNLSHFKKNTQYTSVVGLPRLTPLQAPQSARREDGGEAPGRAEREERPDPEEDSAEVSDPGAEKSGFAHVQGKEVDQRHSDLAREFGQLHPPIVEQVVEL